MSTEIPEPSVKSAAVRATPVDSFAALVGGGSVIVARAGSLQALQALCHPPDETVPRFLTARYRLRAGPVFGNLLAAFAADMQRLRRRATGDVRGDLLPKIDGLAPGTVWSMLLESRGWNALDELTDMPQLAGGGALGPQWLRVFCDALRDPDALPTDRRLLLFCEVEQDAGPVPEWHAAIDALLYDAELPPNVTVVLSDAPRGWQGDPPKPRTSEMSDPPAGADQEEVPMFVEAALSGDQPAEVDRLGMARLADGLARLLLLPQTRPLTVGVQAPWGWGKSSFVAFVRVALIRRARSNLGSPKVEELERLDAEIAAPAPSHLSDAELAAAAEVQIRRHHELLEILARNARSNVICVSFNAWRYEGSQQVWAGLARTITGELEGTLSLFARVRSRLAYAIRRRRLQFWLGFVAPVVLALVVAAVAVATGMTDAGDDLAGWPGWLETLVPAGAVLLIAWRFLQVAQPVSARVAGYVEGPDYASRMGYQNEVSDDLKFLYERLPGKPRVVVTVDDLDRCSDDSIMETLQAINLVLGASSFFVVLAIDPDMIHGAIARRRGLKDDDPLARPFAENYLRKIIQLPLHLPPRKADQRFGFVSQLFSNAAQRDFLAAQTSANGGAPERNGAPPAEQLGARTPFSWSPVAVVSPRVQVLKEVQDTKDELSALKAYQEYLEDNPRELKRLVNVHRLVKILFLRPDAPPTIEEQRKLVAWLVFCARWPDLVVEVLRCAEDRPSEDDCIATVQTKHSKDVDLDSFADRLGGDRLSGHDLSGEGTLAAAARISLLVQDSEAETV